MRTKLCLFALLLVMIGPGWPAQDKLTSLTDGEKAQAIETICGRLDRFYVFPDTAARLGARLRERLAAGAFAGLSDPEEFARAVNREMDSIANDKHLRLFFGSNPDLQPREDLALKRILDRIALEERNYGLDKLEILPGNVGYMRIRSVMFSGPAAELLTSAMAFLSNVDALVFDLRGNRGGDPQYMATLFGWFFAAPTHINSIYWRDRDRTTEFWTPAEVPGRKRPDLPLFVLIDRETFSGAEEFAYDLQARKRATIVGETSAGGANPANSWVVYRNLRISIPLGRAINPVTGTNWEGVGVKPDIEVPPDRALDAAVERATGAAREYKEAVRRRLLADGRECADGLARAVALFGDGDAAGAKDLVGSVLKQAREKDLHTQSSINRLGYDFLAKESFPMAIAVLEFNTAAFPASANAFDSLGEAWLRSGDRVRAREAYTKALTLDPKLESAKRALLELGK